MIVLQYPIPGLFLQKYSYASMAAGRDGSISLHRSTRSGFYIVKRAGARHSYKKVAAPGSEPPFEYLLNWIAQHEPLERADFDGVWMAPEYVPPIRPEGKPHYVYFIGGESGPVKIGTSQNPRARLRAVQCHHPYPLSILATVPGGVEVERGLHKRFADHRLNGEWFERHIDIIAEINAAREASAENRK